MKKFTLLLLTAAMLISCLAGCGNSGGSVSESPDTGSSESPDTGSSESPDAGSSESLTSDEASSESSIVAYVGTNIFDESLDPIKGAMSYGYSFTNAALIKVTSRSEYIGDMATDWSVSDDALSYTFNLRPGIKFSDGTDMTAEDVVFTYETVKANQAENENVDLSRLSSVTAVDDSTVQFNLTEPYSPFLDTTAMLGIVPKASYDSSGFDQSPIGTGPWTVVQYDANQQIIVRPNQYYYEGAPEIERISLVYLDSESALSAARSGQLDVVMVSPDYAAESISGMTMVPFETMDIRMISLPVLEPHEKDGVSYGNPVTCDKAVRKALAIGIDRKSIIENAFNGIGKPASGFTENLIWASVGTIDDSKPDEANQILEDAGWVYQDESKVRQKDGVPCEFDIYAAQDRYVLAAALAENAAQLGIKINAHSASWDDIADNMNSQGVLWGWGQYSPTVISSLLYSEKAYTGGYDNVVAYENPDADSFIKSALSSTSQDEAVANWKGAQSEAADDYPYLYLVNIEHCYFISDRLDISQDTQIPHPHGHGVPVICNMKDWTVR